MAGTILGLDIGTVRTGIAISRSPVHIPSTLETVQAENLSVRLQQLVSSEGVDHIVVGLPRNMSGNETEQTKIVENIVSQLKEEITVPFSFTDEAATSIKAEAELDGRKKPYSKEDIDMLSAVFILEDYMREHPEIINV